MMTEEQPHVERWPTANARQSIDAEEIRMRRSRTEPVIPTRIEVEVRICFVPHAFSQNTALGVIAWMRGAKRSGTLDPERVILPRRYKSIQPGASIASGRREGEGFPLVAR